MINSITSNGVQYLNRDNRGDLHHVVDGGVIGNGNGDRIFFSDAGSLSGTAGEIIAVSKYMLVDVDGDGFSDTEIDMRKSHLLTKADFILDVA